MKSTPIAGSLTMKRVCHARGEWAATRGNAEDTGHGTEQHPTDHFENFGSRDANSGWDEPPRLSRRLHPLRGLSDEEVREVFT